MFEWLLGNKKGGGKPRAAAGRKPDAVRPTTPRPSARPAPSAAPKEAPSRQVMEDDEDATPLRGPGLTRAPRAGVPARSAPRVPAAAASTPDDDTLAAIEKFTGRVLTAEGGPIGLTSRQRSYVAALDNGILLIGASGVGSPSVSAARTLIDRSDAKISKVYHVELETIRKVYDGHRERFGGTEMQRDTAQMQKAVVELVRAAAGMRCSDIHITVYRYEAVIRVRSDGVMTKLRELPAATANDLCQAAFNMADASDPAYKPFDYQGARITSVKTSLPEGVQAVRLQFNPLPDGGRYLVMRLLYSQSVSTNADIDELGYGQHQIRQIKRMRERPVGIIIISGPTGSGKSTTLQRNLQKTLADKRYEVNVITVEDPPEYEIRGAAQLPVTNVKTEEERREAFRQAITASLRSDPDIVMIGEIRDGASASLAFQAAMTGHQVWASLHANDALSILDRLRDQGVETYKLADHSLVTGLIGQRLVRTLCPHCKISYAEARRRGFVAEGLEQAIGHALDAGLAERSLRFAEPKGCDNCRKGYTGRTVVAETIMPDRGFMAFIAEGNKIGAYQYWLEKLDGMSMLEHGILKMVAGEIDPREVADRIDRIDDADPERIRRFLREEADYAGARPSRALPAAQDEAEQETA